MTSLNVYRPRHFIEEVLGSWPFNDIGVPVSIQEENRLLGSEVTESDQQFTVRVELPGINKQDIGITYQEDVLKVYGEKKESHQAEEDLYQHRGISYGTFERKYRLKDINFGKAKADLENGVLTIQLPKQEEKQPKILRLK